VLKGDLSDGAVLHAAMDYACDSAAFVPQLVYLAFLRRTGDLIVPANFSNGLSVVGIDGRINWFVGSSGFDRRYQNIDDVVKQIHRVLAPPGAPTRARARRPT
jgi:hypothetical protein